MSTKALINTSAVPLSLSYTAQELDRLQTDLLSTARKWAIQEVNAEMAHKINEPLTALLLYLHEIIETQEHDAGMGPVSDSIQKAVDSALRQTERICDILQEIGQTTEARLDVEIAAREGDAMRRSPKFNNMEVTRNGSSVASTAQPQLTTREFEVLALITAGASNKEGSCKLGISTRTFEVHRAHIMEKFGARNAADLVRRALSEPERAGSLIERRAAPIRCSP